MLFGSYGSDVYESVSGDLRKKKIKETKMIQSIDVYSLGILVPLLFLFHTQLWNEKNPSETFLKQVIDGNELVKDFFILFGQMVHPSSNQRITSNDASIQFKRLLKKYHPKKVKKEKKEKKISRRKTSRKTKKRSMKRRKNSTPRIIVRENMRREAY
jgi:hypothetical protein